MDAETTNGKEKEGLGVKKFLEKQVAKGVKFEEIALKLGVSYATVISWKYGYREPKGPTRKLIENLYGANAL